MTMTPPPPAPPNGNGRTPPQRDKTGGLTATVSSDVGAAPRRRPTVTTLLIALGVIAALNVLIFAFSIASKETPGPAIPTAIEQLLPVRNGLIPRQGIVGADLQDDYTGVIIIDGREIPEDQLDRRVAQGVVTFQPGAEKEFEIFNPGHYHMKLLYWKQVETRDQAHEFNWEFNVD